MSLSLVLIAHNLRSAHNVGSLLRTSEGLGVECVYLSGYSPYPLKNGDSRLPHIAQKQDRQIAKTALGAETYQKWRHSPDLTALLTQLKAQGYTLAALEQTATAKNLSRYTPPDKLALLVGREVEGVEPEILEKMDIHLEIPMAAQKESFNVSIAAAMALFYIKLKGNGQL